MSRDSNINQFIPLHFYEVGERLPDDDSYKIVIYKTGIQPFFGKEVDFAIANYDSSEKKWTSDHLYEIDKIIAWASFSPEWVTGNYPGEWGKQ